MIYGNRCVFIAFALLSAVIFIVHTIFNDNYHYVKEVIVPKRKYTNPINRTVIDTVICTGIRRQKRMKQRGQFVVFENFIMAEKEFKCWESVTLTVPGDYRFLDNVEPLIQRWEGPISIALYSPGHDFFTTLQCIAYLRNCATPLVREFITFHLFFDFDHMPLKTNPSLFDVYEDTFDCNLKPPYSTMKDSEMYKESHNLTYPINVARNIAKLAAQTYYVFPSDIELYPTRNFIPKFLNFINYYPIYGKEVFVLPIFEVVATVRVPENKSQLHRMFHRKQAISFHQDVCSPCHDIPRLNAWLEAKEDEELDVFLVTKRQGTQIIWEPFFVCTQDEPLWDERLNWEGQGNKMSQAYTLCLLDYDFVVFDNAFLVHKPGIKRKKVQVLKHPNEVTKNVNILIRIQKELQEIYGSNKKCKIHNIF